MTSVPAKTPEWRNVDRAVFHNEIVPRNRPAVLKGLVAHWPAVRAGAESPRAMSQYLQSFDLNRPFVTLIGDPAIKGRFFYRDDLKGVNFERKREPFAVSMDRLLGLIDTPNPPSVFIQSAAIRDHLPAFEGQNTIDLLDGVAPRIWIGNSVVVQTHFDPFDNIACVAAGRRRFTFFPPEQFANLYAGPLDATPSGAPVSMVSLLEPDFERYPRFAQALEAAESAELEAGDAVYIPYFWWHHVQSLSRFNVLINYWWNDAQAFLGSPFDCLLHAVLSLRDLPPRQRDVWRMMFEHYIFQAGGEPLAHLPTEQRGMMGPLTPERAQSIRADLARLLGRPG
jgi:hypothetical protein